MMCRVKFEKGTFQTIFSRFFSFLYFFHKGMDGMGWDGRESVWRAGIANLTIGGGDDDDQGGPFPPFPLWRFDRGELARPLKRKSKGRRQKPTSFDSPGRSRDVDSGNPFFGVATGMSRWFPFLGGASTLSVAYPYNTALA